MADPDPGPAGDREVGRDGRHQAARAGPHRAREPSPLGGDRRRPRRRRSEQSRDEQRGETGLVEHGGPGGRGVPAVQDAGAVAEVGGHDQGEADARAGQERPHRGMGLREHRQQHRQHEDREQRIADSDRTRHPAARARALAQQAEHHERECRGGHRRVDEGPQRAPVFGLLSRHGQHAADREGGVEEVEPVGQLPRPGRRVGDQEDHRRGETGQDPGADRPRDQPPGEQRPGRQVAPAAREQPDDQDRRQRADAVRRQRRQQHTRHPDQRRDHRCLAQAGGRGGKHDVV